MPSEPIKLGLAAVISQLKDWFSASKPGPAANYLQYHNIQLPSAPDDSLLFVLPTELLNYICSLTENPSDLLALALTSRRLFHIIVPQHLGSRHLRCDIRRISLWNTLAGDPVLASRITTIELINEVSGSDICNNLQHATVILPRALDGQRQDFDIEFRKFRREVAGQPFRAPGCCEALAVAIGCMVHLTRFTWDFSTQSPSEYDPIFSALCTRCPELREVELYHGGFYRTREVALLGKQTIFKFKNLARFSLHGSLRLDVPQTDLLSDTLIHSCPHLEHLRIDWTLIHSKLFREGNWPNLKSLSTCFPFRATSEELETFFRRHNSLQHLSCPGFPNISTMEHPKNLRELRVYRGDSDNGLTCELTKSLEFLSIFSFPWPQEGDPASFIEHLPNLRCLFVHAVPSGETVKRVALNLPHLERLRMIWPWGWLMDSNVEDESESGIISRACDFLSQFNRLTHLSCFVRLCTSSNSATTTVLKRISKACSTLQFVEVQIYRGSRWITIERDDDGVFTGWTFTTRLRGVKVADWGGMYFSHVFT